MKVRAACRVVCCLWPVRRRLSLFSGLNPSLLPHSSERLSFSAAPPSPSLSHSWMMKTPLAVFQTADKRSLSPSAFKNEHITCLKQQQPSFSTPPPHGTKAIRKHTHTHPTQISNLLPPGYRFATISGLRGGGQHRSYTDQILMGREWTLVQGEITRGQLIGSRSRCLTPLYGPVCQKQADLLSCPWTRAGCEDGSPNKDRGQETHRPVTSRRMHVLLVSVNII